MPRIGTGGLGAVMLMVVLAVATPAAAADGWTWTPEPLPDVPPHVGSVSTEGMTGPDGAAWFIGRQSQQNLLIRRAGGAESFRRAVPIQITSVTFGPDASAYAAGTVPSTPPQPSLTRLYRVSSEGAVTPLGEFVYNDFLAGTISVQYGPHGLLALQVNRTLRLLDPATGATRATYDVEGSNGGPVGSFLQTGWDALHFYDYVGDYARLRPYANLSSSVRQAATALDVAEPSIAADGSTLITGRTISAGVDQPCSEARAQRFGPAGALQFDVPLSALVDPAVTRCALIGGVALPGGASVIATRTEPAAAPVLIWLDEAGKKVNEQVPETGDGTHVPSADLVVDDQGRVVLAFTVASQCADDVDYNLFCADIQVLVYDGTGEVVDSTIISGDGAVGSPRRFVRLRADHLEAPAIWVADGYLLLSTIYEPYDPGPCGNCGAFGSSHAFDAAPLDVKRPRWHDPTFPKPSAPPVPPDSGSTPPASVGNGAGEAASCPGYVIIDSRGSGGKARHLSEPAVEFVRYFRALHRGAVVAVEKNPYPAVGIWSLWPGGWRDRLNGAGALLKVRGLGAYRGSVDDGRRWLAARIGRQIRSCGAKTKIVLTGYSQGAQVAGHAFQRDLTTSERKRVAGVALFGDPYFNHRDKMSHRGNHARLNGLLGTRRPFRTRKVVSYCHKHDPICQAPLAPAVLARYRGSKHNNYGLDGQQAARLLTRRGV